MSTIINTDLFLVTRAGTNYQVTGADVATFALLSGLPSQGGNTGKVLSTNGSNVLSWITVGGTGTVTSVDVSGGTTGLTYSGGPITASGTITMAGNLAVANGGTGATSAAAALTNLLPAQGPNAGKFLTTDGSVVSWGSPAGAGTVTNVTGTLPITVATGTSTPLIAINAATNAAAGAIEIATLAEAATGTDATRALTPESGVPKDASGMTGAAILPSGTSAQKPGTPVAGMTRLNTDTKAMEFYNGTSWVQMLDETGGAGEWFGHSASPS